MTRRTLRDTSILRRGRRARGGLTGGRLIGGALLGLVLVAPGVGLAQDSDKRLEQVERALEASETQSETLARKADVLQKEIVDLQDKSIATAEKTQNLESRLTRIETMLQDLEVKHEIRTAELQAQHDSLYHTLAALQRIAVQPTEAVLVSRGTPVERVRSALLLKAAIPAIEERAVEIRRDLEEITSLRLAIEQQQVQLAATSKALAEERSLLGQLIDRKQDLYAQTLGARDSAESDAERLAVEAENLRDLLTRLEEQSRLRELSEARARIAEQVLTQAERETHRAQGDLAARQAEKQTQLDRTPPELAEQQEFEATTSLAGDGGEAGDPAQGDGPAVAALTPDELERPDNVRAFPQGAAIPLLIMPVRGQLVLAYGQRATGAESASKGISISTRTQAQVVAPYDGQVVYAGAFRGYGQILIIEHGGRYHTLLAGLERIDAVTGQWILAGEPIGIMGGPQERSPELYLELRHAGQPVNPLPWLATTDDKVQG